MKAIGIVCIALLAAVSATYVALRPHASLKPGSGSGQFEVQVKEAKSCEVSLSLPESAMETGAVEVVYVPEPVREAQQAVQSVEDRGDAMLFEMDALQGTPFDQAVVMPFD